MAPDMTLSQFDLIGFPHGNETLDKPHRGPYSLLWVTFELQRHTGYFIINVYVPCSMLVVISWVGFWINREATSDRIALGVTTVLTMAFLGIDNRRDLPKVSYSTALDYYVGMCFAFVLATIIQFAGVHWFTKQGSGEPLPESTCSDDETDDDDIDGVTVKPVTRFRQKSFVYKRHSLHSQSSRYRPSVDDRTGAYDKPRSEYRSKFGCCRRMFLCSEKPRVQAKPLHVVDFQKTSSMFESSMPIGRDPVGGRFESSLPIGRDVIIGDYITDDIINSVSTIDKLARVLFPAFFIAFNIFYWTWYS